MGKNEVITIQTKHFAGLMVGIILMFVGEIVMSMKVLSRQSEILAVHTAEIQNVYAMISDIKSQLRDIRLEVRK